MLPRHLFAAAVATVAATAILPAAAPAAAAEPVVVIDGHGFGHGVGMSQEGARTMGAQGATAGEILEQFYPGTVKGSAAGEVRVVVLDAGVPAATVELPQGGQVHGARSGAEPPGFPLAVPPGGTVDLTFSDGAYHAAVRRRTAPRAARASGTGALRGRLIAQVGPPPTLPGAGGSSTSVTTTTSTTTTMAGASSSTTPSTAPRTSTTATTVARAPAATTVPPAPAAADPPPGRAPGPLWVVPSTGGVTELVSRGRRYRGAIEVAAGANGDLRLVDRVDVEAYLKGMGEILDPGWPAAALRAQAVAARTYALRAMSTGGELCDDDRCQVYLGETAEYPAMSAAVDATRREVRMFGGALASTVYSSNGGGVSATAEEGFGAAPDDYPYLASRPYPSADPGPWTVRTGLAGIGGRLGYGGVASAVRVSAAGPSGRALEVTVDGSSGPMTVGGRDFASRLALRSTLFSLRVEGGEGGEAPPPPPPPEPPGLPVLAQELPGAAGRVLAQGADMTVVSSAPVRAPLRGRVPGLLGFLVADVLVMVARARRRRRAAGANCSPSVHPEVARSSAAAAKISRWPAPDRLT